jgi:hypothetical protein
MAYEITEMEFNEKCINCKEPMKGFIVFGRHTPRKTGGDVEFKEFIFKKRTEGTSEIISLLVSGHCPSCNISNMFRCEYNLEKNSYTVHEMNF